MGLEGEGLAASEFERLVVDVAADVLPCEEELVDDLTPELAVAPRLEVGVVDWLLLRVELGVDCEEEPEPDLESRLALVLGLGKGDAGET